MYKFRSLALPFYRWISRSKRDVYARRFTASRQWPAAILFYHRVAKHARKNSWTISPKGFLEHLNLVESIADFASLNEIRRDQQTGVRDRLKVAITFDDAYGDNSDWVIPELIRRSIPCTYFVTTDHVEYGKPFQHDIDCGRPLRPNSIGEIQAMAEAGIQIGGHTRSHLDLGKSWSMDRLRGEISDSRKKLQDWTGQPIDYFAFPYGLPANISQAAIDMIVEAGYQAFVSAFGGWNFPSGDDFHLPRFHGDPCTEAIRNWLTLDPRKIESRPGLEYVKPSQLSHSDSRPSTPANDCWFPALNYGTIPSENFQSF